MKLSFLAALVLLMIVGLLNPGCETADLIGTGVQEAGKQGQIVAENDPALNSMTGGLLGTISLILYSIGSSIIAVNRTIEAKKRGEAIEEIDSKHDTPRAIDQVANLNNRKTVRKVLR